MIITDLMLQTLPSDRMYEFNLNYILCKLKDFQNQLDGDIDDILEKKIENLTSKTALKYNANNNGIYLYKEISWYG